MASLRRGPAVPRPSTCSSSSARVTCGGIPGRVLGAGGLIRAPLRGCEGAESPGACRCAGRGDDAVPAHQQSPSRKVNELDNRGSHFYLALLLGARPGRPERRRDARGDSHLWQTALEAAEETIAGELIAAQGSPVDIGGYYICPTTRPSLPSDAPERDAQRDHRRLELRTGKEHRLPARTVWGDLRRQVAVTPGTSWFAGRGRGGSRWRCPDSAQQ